jgi:hypothetical protein
VERLEDDNLPSLDAKVERIHASLGEDSGSEVGRPTSAWGTIVMVGMQLRELATAVRETDDQSALVEQEQATLKMSFGNFKDGLIGRLGQLGNRLVALESGGSGDAPAVAGSEMNAFKEEVRRDFSEYRERITIVETENTLLASRLNQESVTMGGITFHNQNDCKVWVASHISPGNYYNFYDGVSLIEQMKDPSQSFEKATEAEHRAFKVNMTTSSQRMVFSYQTIVPHPYMKGPGTAAKPLTKLESFKQWDHNDGVGGVKNEIAAFLQRQVKAETTKIRTRFANANELEAKTVALACLQESRAFIAELHLFMSEFYTELVASESPDSEAWTLTCKLVHGIFHQLHLVRSVAAGVSDIGADNTGRRIGLVLWGSLQAHRVMREFSAAQFRRHPTIASTLMLHLFASNVSEAKVTGLQSEVAELTKALKITKAEASKALDLATKKK